MGEKGGREGWVGTQREREREIEVFVISLLSAKL